MSQPRSLWNGFAIMFIGVVLSVLFMATLGQLGDRTITILADIGMFAVPEEWDTSNTIYTFQSLLFFLCVLPGITGMIIFILSAVRRQRYDKPQEPQIDYTPQYGGSR